MIARTLVVAGALVIGTASAIAESATSNPVTVAPAYRQAIPNVPGKSLVGVVVSYAPGAKSAAHHHASSAFISAYVLSGAVRSQVDDEPAKVYRAGESWFEQPGAHHKISENASATEPAQLLAIFVVDTDEKVLTTPDQK
ncbi:MAG: cupin domain-containing protein [Rhizomicrobium sp.]